MMAPFSYGMVGVSHGLQEMECCRLQQGNELAVCCRLHTVLTQLSPVTADCCVPIAACSSRFFCLPQASLGSRQQSGWCLCPSRSRQFCRSRRGPTLRLQVHGCRCCAAAAAGKGGAVVVVWGYASCLFKHCPTFTLCILRSVQARWCGGHTRQAATSLA